METHPRKGGRRAKGKCRKTQAVTDRQRGLQGATKTGGGGKQGNERHRREPQEDRKRG
jgi:hypothetical protein